MALAKEQRERMVETQIAARGIRNERVLKAMRTVPREQFVPPEMHEFAYEDSPLPIEEAQTISQPYIVALMAESLELEPGDRVLEVGAGSGYAAAVLGQVVRHVFAIERHETLARLATERMQRLGYANVTVMCGDGTRGWPEHAPFDAIAVAAGGPTVPHSLLEQLAIGGRLVIPVGSEPRTQELLRIVRRSEDHYEETSLGRVQFVPLIGSEGWTHDGMPIAPRRARQPVRVLEAKRDPLVATIRDACEPFDDLAGADLAPILERIGDARVVLIGEASHGTSEFYRMRARITQALIRERGFNVVGIEGDWPDTRTIDRYVRGEPGTPLRTPAFSRFPTWMWRNRETHAFVEWLKDYHAALPAGGPTVTICGLDLYSLYNSIGAVLDYLDRVDPLAADAARIRYGCFSPWETDPATYGRAAVSREMPTCEEDVVGTLADLLEQRLNYLRADGESFFDAVQNAKVVRDAEQYYRVMYYGSRESWNLRDRHMFATLQAVLKFRGDGAKAVVWAHNSHVGNAAATEMGLRGELNIGQLAKEEYGRHAYAIGFGTDHGTVAATSNWDEPVAFQTVRPSHEDSYERLCHDTGVRSFFLPLREAHRPAARKALFAPHLERAIGVVYRPETEVLSHYFQAALPAQFDEYIWFDETRAVEPLETHEVEGMPETYPFGL